jgi:5'-nucleotidase
MHSSNLYLMTDIVPFDNPFVVKRLSGHTLLHSLENSVSDARTDGRFLQLSGLAIVTDFRLPEGSRILSATVISNNRAASDPHKGPIRTDTFYTVAMASFIADGFDGYTLFQTEPTIVNVESATTDTSLMLKIFRGNSHNNDIGRNKDETDIAIDRARATVLVGSNDGLPAIQPQVQGRISTTGHSFV